MKRITLLFLALSSLALAGVEIRPGSNFGNTNTTSASSATIDVSVSATVNANPPDLIITDQFGNEVSEVTFNHVLIESEDNATQSLVANLKLKGDALGAVGESYTNFSTKTLELKNDDNTLTSTLDAEIGTISNGEAPLTVSSNLTGTPKAGDYSLEQSRLTVTINKNKN